MDYNKIIIALIIILIAVAAAGFAFLNGSNSGNNAAAVNNTSQSVSAEKISQDDVAESSSGPQSVTLNDGRVVEVGSDGRIISDDPTLNGYTVDEINRAIYLMERSS